MYFNTFTDRTVLKGNVGTHETKHNSVSESFGSVAPILN